MGILYRGNTQFEESEYPRRTKNDWGVDVLTRTFRGRQPLLVTYLATLAQGQTYSDGSHTFYLQTWSDDGNAIFPKVELVYKGFLSGLPAVDGQNTVTSKTATISADVEGNTDLIRTIKGDNENVAKTPTGGTNSTTVHAVREVFFSSPQTRWRYITSSRPNGPTYSAVNTTSVATMLRSRITAKWKDKEMVFAGNAPASLVSALSMITGNRIESHSANHIIGTPYWECEDVVSNEFIGDS